VDMMDWSEWSKYPRIPHLQTMRSPNARVLLGKKLCWTFKRDGSNITIWVMKRVSTSTSREINGVSGNVIQISSRNMLDASSDLKDLVKHTEEYPKILKLLDEHPQFRVYVEACREGRSVTGAEHYDHDFLIVFDIYDRKAEKWLPYVNVHQHCYHWKIPVVKLYAETRHRSMKDLLKFKNHVLEYCEATHLEGMVIKTHDKTHGYVQAKVKLDVPEPLMKKIRKGQPIYPPVPENEILGAVDKAWQQLGTKDFKDVRKAMPLIAQLVGEECKKHLYSSPKRQLFGYYKEYLERLME